MRQRTSASSSNSRRQFLKNTAAVAAAGFIAASAHAAEDNTIRLGLVGCGGRGTGAAADAMSTSGPTKLVAMADLFPDRMQSSLNSLKQRFGAKVDVPPDRQFLGFDAFRRAIGCLEKSDVILLATPAAYRPIHLEYAVLRGLNVFMEKSFAVDAPGIRRVLKAGQTATQKNLKIATGLMWRHDLGRQALMERLHRGDIGDLTLLRTYRMHGAVPYAPKPANMSEIEHQIRNYNCFTWCNASFFVDWLIHNIDVCCWAKNAWPVNAQGHAGRSARTQPDQLFDHYAVEYTFADGAKLLVQGRHIEGCHNIFSDFFHGTKGSAAIYEVLAADPPRIYNSQKMTKETETWRYPGPLPNPYQREHDNFFDALRNNKPYNETERGAMACMTSILGRMAAHSGKLITFEQALASNLELAPNLENLTFDSPAPVMPDPQGRYPLSIPGQTREF